jgi:hypothetical protein
MSQRIDIMLPKETEGKRSLRERLAAGYLANAGENLRIAAEWFPVEEEACRTSRAGLRAKSKKQPIRTGAKSTSGSIPPAATKSRRPGPRWL